MRLNMICTTKFINKGYDTTSSILNLIKYIIDDTDEKKKKVQRIGGNAVTREYNAKKLANGFKLTQEVWQKKYGKRVHHWIVSFENHVKDIDVAYECATEIAHEILGEYQVVFAIHEDTDNLHIHFAINSVSFINGKKFHISNQDMYTYREKIEEIVKRNFS